MSGLLPKVKLLIARGLDASLNDGNLIEFKKMFELSFEGLLFNTTGDLSIMLFGRTFISRVLRGSGSWKVLRHLFNQHA
jgi:hypothetical protein